jgi:hypothetical protein
LKKRWVSVLTNKVKLRVLINLSTESTDMVWLTPI